LSNQAELFLWRDLGSRNWVWLNDANDVVYWQQWRPEWKKFLVFNFIPQVSAPKATAYDFRSFKCFV
jgi:hypothetical protein